MPEPNWGMIRSGATFEALATTIVFFEDPGAVLFGRRGKDGGQDARSGDGTLVYQAKHHADQSAARAIADAKKEAQKIRDFRKPGNSRYTQWKSVTSWRLITNAPFNPSNRQAWDSEVVPRFTALGLTADCWTQADLDLRLARHPEIHRSFFGNETRALLSIPEIRERLPEQEPFLHRAEVGGFFGRDAELAKVRDFLRSESLFLVVHGAGGIGKTRLLVEAGDVIAGEGEWQVLWANVATMSATGAWFGAIVPERPTLLVVDEPSDETLLQQLAEQLGGRVGRTTQWKVVVAVRSQQDPILRFLSGPRIKPRQQQLVIEALPTTAAEEMCATLLANGKLANWPEPSLREAARELSRRFSRHPVWLTLAVHALETRGNLTSVPETAEGLADSYLTEAWENQKDLPPDAVRDLVRWVALLGTVDRSDDATMRLLGEGIGTSDIVEVRRRLASLTQRRVLTERGASNRLVELKPDVLRDHVLLRWLVVDVDYGGQPMVASEHASRLVEEVSHALRSGSPTGLARTILVSLARCEFLLRLSGRKVPLLDQFFRTLREATSQFSASQRLAAIAALTPIAEFRPLDCVRVVEALRNSVAADETIDGVFGPRVVGQKNVLLALAWLAFHAALGARTQNEQDKVLDELCVLVELEGDLASSLDQGLPNDGQRAAYLVETVLEGGPQFWGDFDLPARRIGKDLLIKLAQEPPSPGNQALLKALVQPAIALERRQSWSDESKLTMRTYAIGPQHPAWETRDALLTLIKAALATDTTPLESRVALWTIFAEAHRNVNRLFKPEEPRHPGCRDMLLANLAWAHETLEGRNLILEELRAARKLWDWHHQFERDPQLKEASEKLEAIYAGNGLAAEFELLLGRGQWKQHEACVTLKVAELAAAGSTEDIQAFIDRAARFLGGEDGLSRLTDVFWLVGEHAPSKEVVRAFVRSSLGSPSVSPRNDLGAVVAARWVGCVRNSETPHSAHQLVSDLLALCGSDSQRANVLLQIYGRVHTPAGLGLPTREEHELLRGSAAVFLASGRAPAFVAAVARTVHYDWPGLSVLLESVLKTVPDRVRDAAIEGLLSGIHAAVCESNLGEVPVGLRDWLLEQLISVADLDDLNANAEWHVERLLERLGRPPLSWLVHALERRSRIEAGQSFEAGFRALSHRSALSRFVRRVSDADAGDPDVRSAIQALIGLFNERGSVGFCLPEVLCGIDPEGILVPELVAQRFGTVECAEDFKRLARIAGHYPVGTVAWRTIAKAALCSDAPYRPQEPGEVFHAISDSGIMSWTSNPGEVASVFVRAVDRAKDALNSELDLDFRPFWQWRVAVAEAELRAEEERVKEERGE